jgi:hypothetical protein
MKNQWRISVFEPFFGRHDHRTAEQQETEELYQQARRLHAAFRYAGEEAFKAYKFELFGRFEESLPENLRSSFFATLAVLLWMETTIFSEPEYPPSLSLKEMVELRAALRRKAHFHANEGRILERLEEGVLGILEHIAGLLPATLDPSPFSVPLIYVLPQPKKLLDDLYTTLWQERYVEASVFVELTRQMHRNICEVSGIQDIHEPKRPYVKPSDNRAPLHEIVPAYLKYTPFEDLFSVPVPLKFTEEERFSHAHVIGGNKAGKTTLMKRLIQHDLDAGASLIIVDSHNDLADFAAHLDLGDRLIFITPRDIAHPPSINIFAPSKRFTGYDELEREQVSAAAIQTLDFLFEGMGIDLTGKQGILFEYCARFLLAFPRTFRRNATLIDLIALMGDITPYRDAVRNLPDEQRSFFERDFNSPTFRSTREEVRYRLQGIRQNPLIGRLFTAQETKIDFFDALNTGAVIVIDTAKDVLKDDSGLYGRIFLSLILQAVFERAVLPERDRHPAFLYVDEAHEYFDKRTKTLLTDARKFKLGCLFAHHALAECGHELRAALMTEPAIRLAARVSPEDARSMATGMRTTADFILDQEPHHFACYIQDVTRQAVSVSVSKEAVDEAPRLSETAYQAMLLRNRERVSAGEKREKKEKQQADAPQPEAPDAGASTTNADPDDDDEYRL